MKGQPALHGPVCQILDLGLDTFPFGEPLQDDIGQFVERFHFCESAIEIYNKIFVAQRICFACKNTKGVLSICSLRGAFFYQISILYQLEKIVHSHGSRNLKCLGIFHLNIAAVDAVLGLNIPKKIPSRNWRIRFG